MAIKRHTLEQNIVLWHSITLHITSHQITKFLYLFTAFEMYVLCCYIHLCYAHRLFIIFLFFLLFSVAAVLRLDITVCAMNLFWVKI